MRCRGYTSSSSPATRHLHPDQPTHPYHRAVFAALERIPPKEGPPSRPGDLIEHRTSPADHGPWYPELSTAHQLHPPVDLQTAASLRNPGHPPVDPLTSLGGDPCSGGDP